MIWALLALLGVPLWAIAGVLVYMALLNRRLRRRDGDIPVRVRLSPGKRWRRGHALWAGDVFAWRSSPAGWNESLDLIISATSREITEEEAHHLRRLDDPVLVVLAGDERVIEVAVSGARKASLLRQARVDSVAPSGADATR